MSPILFMIYVNDLPSLVKCKMKMYADDTKLYKLVSGLRYVQLLKMIWMCSLSDQKKMVTEI